MNQKRLWIALITLIVGIFCGATIASDAEVLGYWSFNNKDDLGKDSSPNHNHGNPKGDRLAFWVAGGKVGGGMKVEGDSWLEVPHDDSLNVKDKITLMCWVKFARYKQVGSNGLIGKALADDIVPRSSYALGAGIARVFERPFYSSNNFHLWIIKPGCRGRFIVGIPDFPPACIRKFIFDRRSSINAVVGFRADQPIGRSMVASHQLFLFFPFIGQAFYDALADLTAEFPDLPLPKIVRNVAELENTWFHFAGVSTGRRMRLFINGEEKESIEQTAAFTNSHEPLTIGKTGPNIILGARLVGNSLDGIIDEVMILDQALTADQIKEAMELGKKGESLENFDPPLSIETRSKLLIKWGEIKIEGRKNR